MNSRRLFDKFKEELLEKNNIKIVSTISENGYPSIAFRNCLFTNSEDEIILLEPVETSVNNRNLTYSIWFNKKVLIALWNFERYGLLAYATIKRVIISGKEFEKYYKFYPNYISLFSYLFISYQMSAKPYFIGYTGIYTFCSRSHIGAYLLMFSLSNVVNFVVNTSMLSDALSLFWHSQ